MSIDGSVFSYEDKSTIENEDVQIFWERQEKIFSDSDINRTMIADSVKILPDLNQGEAFSTETENGITSIKLGKDFYSEAADYWLRQTFWAGQTDTSQTFTINNEDRVQIKRVLFVEGNRFPVLVHIHLSTFGSLQSINTEWKAESISEASSSMSSSTVVIDTQNPGSDKIKQAIEIIGYILITISIFIILIIYFRRYIAQLIDTRSAYSDAFFGMIVIFPATLFPEIADMFYTGEIGFFSLLLMLLISLLAAFFIGIKFFLLAGVGVSVTHEAYSRSMTSLNILRRGFLMNQPVGSSLFFGILAGTIAAGIAALIAVLFYQTPVSASSEIIKTSLNALITDFSSALNNLILIYLLVFGLFLTIGMAYYNRVKNWTKTYIFLFIPLLFWNLNRIELNSWIYVLLSNALLALAWIFIFKRYDALTLCFSLLIFTFWMKMFLGFIPNGWLSLHLFVFLGLMITGLFVGYTAMKNGSDMYDIPEYTPAYILEHSRRERIEQELQIARQVQENFLPRKAPLLEGLQIEAQCTPAFEIGGDYFDFIRIDEKRTGIIIGDVSGKGIQAAFYMTLVKGFVQSLCCDITHPGDLMIKINTLFRENVPRGTFITMLYGIYNRETGIFTFVRAGHDPLMILSDKKVALYKPNGLPLGMVDKPRFEANLEVMQIELKKGDAAVLFTDGYTETRNRRGEFFGDERLMAVLKDTRILSAKDIMDRMARAVNTFRGDQPQHDDVTTVVMYKT